MISFKASCNVSSVYCLYLRTELPDEKNPAGNLMDLTEDLSSPSDYKKVGTRWNEVNEILWYKKYKDKKYSFEYNLILS